jgi:hypothetical protein
VRNGTDTGNAAGKVKFCKCDCGKVGSYGSAINLSVSFMIRFGRAIVSKAMRSLENC